MMQKSAKTVAQQKRKVLSGQPGELTCNESQVEDMLSAGESTEEERIDPSKQPGRRRLPHHAAVPK
jgi:hypothetical protein